MMAHLPLKYVVFQISRLDLTVHIGQSVRIGYDNRKSVSISSDFEVLLCFYDKRVTEITLLMPSYKE